MRTPLVSVVLPTTGSPWLGEAISSVLAQTMTDLELIVVDGTEGGDADLSVWSDPRIRVLRVPWRGLAAARNAGNAASRAPYVAVIDHDDVWLPQKLERQLPLLEASSATGMCHTQWEGIDTSGAVVGPGLALPVSPESILEGRFWVLHSSTVWRRTVVAKVGGYSPTFVLATDVDLVLKVLAVSDITFEPSVLAQYRLHSQNVSRNYRAQYASLQAIYRHHLPSLARQAGYRRPTRKQRCTMEQSLRAAYFVPAWDAAVSAVQEHQLRSALAHMVWAAKLRPPLAARLLAKWGQNRLSAFSHSS
jgi:glycosyltransferase involved in cell wall biosynthesis